MLLQLFICVILFSMIFILACVVKICLTIFSSFSSCSIFLVTREKIGEVNGCGFSELD